MPTVPAAALAQARTEHDRLLPDLCDILRETETHGSGGVSTVEAVIATAVACRIAPVGTTLGASGEAELAGRLGLIAGKRLALPALTDLTAADRVRVTVSGQAAQTFEVRYVNGRRSWEIGCWALLEAVP